MCLVFGRFELAVLPQQTAFGDTLLSQAAFKVPTLIALRLAHQVSYQQQYVNSSHT
jgi:hypothetical protein